LEDEYAKYVLTGNEIECSDLVRKQRIKEKNIRIIRLSVELEAVLSRNLSVFSGFKLSHVDDSGSLYEIAKQPINNLLSYFKLYESKSSNDSLFQAIKLGRLEQLEDAINSGVNLNKMNAQGFSPLMFAVEHNNIIFVNYLIRGIATINRQGSHSDYSTFLCVTMTLKQD